MESLVRMKKVLALVWDFVTKVPQSRWLKHTFLRYLKVRICKINAFTDSMSVLHYLTSQFSRSVMSDSVTPCTRPHQASLSITNSWSLLTLMHIESAMPSNHLTLCHPLFLQPSIFLSTRVFSNESVLCIRWPKYWSFSISPSNEYSEFISFKINWFDLLAAQQTLKSFLQHHSSKVSILHHSAFFIV